MKKLYFSFCLMFLSAFSFSQWSWQNPLPQGNKLNSIIFKGLSNGYAVGEAGTFIKTTDNIGFRRDHNRNNHLRKTLNRTSLQSRTVKQVDIN